MSQTHDEDTICAPATPVGGALCIIRISGPRTHNIIDTIARGKQLCQIDDENGQPLDQVILTRYHAPHSYTGEDAAEISCHGSPYIVRKILEQLCKQGCRIAQPGEFTQRAFLHGKMDLSAAEAVADLIACDHAATHRMAIGQLKGSVRNALATLREQLLQLTSLLELELDFSDHEDLTFADRNDLARLLEDTQAQVSRLIESYTLGRALKEGITVAIIGPPNAGKSTLLNRLAGHERAIVTPYAGTTRDTIEENIDIHGVRFRLIDTAGLRTDTNDPIEQLGIERTQQAIQQAHIVLSLTPATDELQPSSSSTPLPTPDELPAEGSLQPSSSPTLLTADDSLYPSSTPILHLRTKADLLPSSEHPSTTSSPSELLISAKTGEGIDTLIETIYQSAHLPEVEASQPIINNARHLHALQQADESLRQARQAMNNNLPPELLSEHLRTAIHALGTITGDTITPDITLANIFAHFCVGK